MLTVTINSSLNGVAKLSYATSFGYSQGLEFVLNIGQTQQPNCITEAAGTLSLRGSESEQVNETLAHQTFSLYSLNLRLGNWIQKKKPDPVGPCAYSNSVATAMQLLHIVNDVDSTHICVDIYRTDIIGGLLKRNPYTIKFIGLLSETLKCFFLKIWRFFSALPDLASNWKLRLQSVNLNETFLTWENPAIEQQVITALLHQPVTGSDLVKAIFCSEERLY